MESEGKRCVLLSELEPSKKGMVVEIRESDMALLSHLASLGLLPDARVEIVKKAPLDGPVVVQVGASRYAIGLEIASKILVREM